MCLCTGMLYDGKAKEKKSKKIKEKVFKRLKHIKETMFLKKIKHETNRDLSHFIKIT